MTGCPSCGGEQMPNHPAGVLAIRHTNTCPVRDDEDGTRVADQDRTQGQQLTRPATSAERLLLDHLGYAVPAEVITVLTPMTTSVIGRTFTTAGARPAPLTTKETDQ